MKEIVRYIYYPHIQTIMRRILLTGILISSMVSANAQADIQKLKPAVKIAAKKMNDALVKKNLHDFVKTTYPKVVESTPGGAEKIEKDLQSQIASIENQGSKILAAWPGDATAIIDTAGEYQCTIPQYMKMKLENGIITTQTTLIALSPDKGKTWYFIDATDKVLSKWRSVFPNLSSKLLIRPAPEPTFVPNKK
ncbi:MAG: hypothetical protein JNK00_11570 [Flavipsychrobacter sp.]|nr:hypothetical protein [Flavipsychrobacter sp.]